MSIDPTSLPISLPSSPAQATRLSAPVIESEDFLTSFKDMVDAVNPLQQIPIIGTIYREFTNSPLSHGARIAGGALYGGPIGLLSAVFNSIIETVSGKDIGDNLLAMFTGEEATQLADASNVIQNDYVPTSRKSAINAYVQSQSLFG